MIRRNFQISNKSGLHARPATIFVEEVKKYASSVKLTFDGEEVNGKSILAVMSLGIAQGTEVDMVFEGDDEDQVLACVEELFAMNFGEKE